MANRIFPTQKNNKIEHSSVVKTIGADKLAKAMDKLSSINVDMTKTASVQDKPIERRKKRYATKNTKCDTCGVDHPCSCDIIAAQTEGDHEKVAAMMEIRANRRMAYMQQLEDVSEQEALNTRTAFRTQLLQELDKFAQDEDVDTEACGETFGSCKKCGKKMDECSCPICKNCKCKPCICDRRRRRLRLFSPLNKLSDDKKAYFARYAEAMEWPIEYVQAITASPIKTSSISEATKMVLANKKLDKDSKKSIIIAMCKEAKLSQEQANRIKTYWSQELDYPDTDWINDLVEEPTGK